MAAARRMRAVPTRAPARVEWFPDAQDATGLSDDQVTALCKIATGQNVFLTAPAGFGKSHLLRHLITALLRREIPYAITAPTGRAALQVGGQTLHSWAGLGLVRDTPDSANKYETSLRRSRSVYWSRVRRRLQQVRVLFIDEVSMVSPLVWSRLELGLQTARRSAHPMGGVQIVVIGDFCQLPYIADDAAVATPLFQTPAWEACAFAYTPLTTCHRQASDPTFAALLHDLRRGTPSPKTMHTLQHRRVQASALPDEALPYLHPYRANVKQRNQARLFALPTTDVQYRHAAVTLTVRARLRETIGGSLNPAFAQHLQHPTFEATPGAAHHVPPLEKSLGMDLWTRPILYCPGESGTQTHPFPHPSFVPDAAPSDEAPATLILAMHTLWNAWHGPGRYSTQAQASAERALSNARVAHAIPANLQSTVYTALERALKSSRIEPAIELRDGTRVMCTQNQGDRFSPILFNARNDAARTLVQQFHDLKPPGMLLRGDVELTDKEKERVTAYRELCGKLWLINGSTGTMRGKYVEWDTMPGALWLLPIATTTVVLDTDTVHVKWPVAPGKGGPPVPSDVELCAQFVHTPITHAWALTIHAAQGATLSRGAVVHLGEALFAPGQAYVAASRVPSLDKLWVDAVDETALQRVSGEAVAFHAVMDKAAAATH